MKRMKEKKRIQHGLNSEPALKQNYVLIHTGFVFKPLSLIYTMSSCHETLPPGKTKYWPLPPFSMLLQSVDAWRPQNLHSQVERRHRIYAAGESYGDKDTQRQW